MNKKDLRKIEMITARENVLNILPSKKKYFYPNKIDKTIEIVIVPKLADITANQQNVGIVLDEKISRPNISFLHNFFGYTFIMLIMERCPV